MDDAVKAITLAALASARHLRSRGHKTRRGIGRQRWGGLGAADGVVKGKANVADGEVDGAAGEPE